ncbi:hypothetical protein ABT348_24120 [Streptomyces olivaceus]|uniref:hypothetical protein n=1 Tax=Streptomyces olivaceus TaxID=47716 RepID=UPI00331ADC64
MAYTRKRRTVTLEFGDEQGEFAGLEVEVKSLSMGEFFKMSKLVHKREMSEQEVESLLRTFSNKLVAWNVEDEDGTRVPASFDGLMAMDLEFNLKIIEVWLKAIAPPEATSDLGKDSPSGEQFPGQPATMEAL